MADNKEYEEMMEQLSQAIAEEAKKQSSGNSQLEMLKEVIPMALEEIDQVTEILDQVIDKVGPKLVGYLERIQQVAVDSRIKTYKAYVGAGMSSSEAVSLIQTDIHNTSMSIREAFKK